MGSPRSIGDPTWAAGSDGTIWCAAPEDTVVSTSPLNCAVSSTNLLVQPGSVTALLEPYLPAVGRILHRRETVWLKPTVEPTRMSLGNRIYRRTKAFGNGMRAALRSQCSQNCQACEVPGTDIALTGYPGSQGDNHQMADKADIS
jgi:hypothetical protein